MNRKEIQKQLNSCLREQKRVENGGEPKIYPNMLKVWIETHRKNLKKLTNDTH